MITKKNLIAMVSIGLCSLVWAPQMLGGSSTTTPVQDVDEDELDDEFDDPWDDEEPGDDDVADLLGTDGAGDPEKVLAGTESLLQNLESFAGGPAGLDLTELVRALDDRSRPLPLTQAAPPTQGTTSDAPTIDTPQLQPSLGAEPLVERVDLEEFAATNGLTGILSGGERRFALLGHRVVSVGDRLWGGRVRVDEIAPDGVQLRAGAATLWLELPPFVASGAGSTEEDDDSVSEDEIQ